MPSQFFKPCPCSNDGRAVLVGGPECRHCGSPQEFVRWRLSMHEGMARYQYVYGFKPIGKHRKMTDELLGSLRRTCDRCGGAGVLSLDRERWRACGACEGTGGFWTCTPDEVERVRDRIRAEHPGAAVADPTPRFIGGALAQYMKTGEMVDLEEESRRDRELVFQPWTNHEGVFLVKRTWERLLAIGRALSTAETWGDFRKALPEGEFESLCIWARDGGEMVYRDGDRILLDSEKYPFDPEELTEECVISSDDPFDPLGPPWVANEHYPPWIEEIERTGLPQEFTERFGHRVDSFLNGSWTQFPMDRLGDMVADLQRRGFEVTVSEVVRRW